MHSREQVFYDFGLLPARILRNRNEKSRADCRASEYAENHACLMTQLS